MFQLLLPLTAITSVYFTYSRNNKMISATGMKGLVLKIGATWVTCRNIMQASEESYQVFKEKETFGSAANFVTTVITATATSNYLMSRNIRFNDFEHATTLMAKLKATVMFTLGLKISQIFTGFIANIPSKAFFNTNESFEEYVNSGKHKAITMLAGSTTIAAAATKIVTSVTKIESAAAKVGLTALLTVPTFITIANVDFKATCGDTKCTISGVVTANDE